MSAPTGEDPISTSITSPATLARLLAVGAGAEGAWDADELALLLRQQLDLPLAFPGPATASAQEVYARPATIGEALADERPTADVLRRIKQHAKSLRAAIPPAVPPEVASVLYYAAILSARVKLAAQISTLDDATLHQGARWCLAQRWLDDERRELFKRAASTLGPAAQ